MQRFLKIARMAGRVLVAAGLLTFYGSIIAVAGVAPPGVLYKGAAAVAVAGCFILATALHLLSQPGKTSVEAILGFACVPALFITGFGALGDEVGVQIPWLIIAVLFLVALLGLFVQSARAKQGAERWRNRPEDRE